METNYDNIYRQNEYETNEKVTKATRLLLYFELMIGVFCLIQVFDISPSIINGFIITTLIPLLLPTLIVDILHIGKPWVKYMIITCVTSVVGICYVFFTFQVIILFVIPTILGALYFGKKVLYFSIIETIITIAISHLITGFVLLQPWIEPFTNMKSIMLYGALPRILQYLLCAIVIYMLNTNYTKFIKGFYIVVRDNELLKVKNTKERMKVNYPELAEQLKLMTERELEVCRLLAEGYTNSQIANQLSLTVGTIKNYVSVIYEKMGLNDRTAVALKLYGYFKENDCGND
jgi:DNA-binding CsgD family transcriptional regulator